MRKLLVLLMVGLLSFSAFGCKKKATDEGEKPGEETEESTETPEEGATE